LSFDAIRWALAQPVPKSSAKFLLVAMANCVNGDGEEMLCWASVTSLADSTSQDRKTVLDGLRRLREAGFIADTGQRRGATGQVPVYRLCSTKNGTASPRQEAGKTPAQADSNSTEHGTDTKDGTVPNSTGNSPESPHQQSRNSAQTVPLSGHGTSKESGTKKEGTKKRSVFDPAVIELPAWLQREDWTLWCRDRAKRNKPITEDAARLQFEKLDKYRGQGHDPHDVIEHCIANSYQGLFPPPVKAPVRGHVNGGKHAAAGRTLFGSAPQDSEVIDVEAR
jgi:hypothetical protein